MHNIASNHYTFPSGAVQGGALAEPEALQGKLNIICPPELTQDERRANAFAAFGKLLDILGEA